MNAIDHYQTMACYNRLMNERLYAVASEVSDEERKRDLGAFFRSVHGTLNHLLLADRAWLGRFTHDRAVFESLDAEGGRSTSRAHWTKSCTRTLPRSAGSERRRTRLSRTSWKDSRRSAWSRPSPTGRARGNAASTHSGGR